MKIEWTLNIGTLIHLIVLVGGILGFWVKLKIRLALIEEEIKSFKSDREEVKETVCEMRDSIQQIQIEQARSSTSLSDLINRFNGKK